MTDGFSYVLILLAVKEKKKSVITKIAEQKFQECSRQEIGRSVQGDCCVWLPVYFDGKVLEIRKCVEMRGQTREEEDGDTDTIKAL